MILFFFLCILLTSSYSYKEFHSDNNEYTWDLAKNYLMLSYAAYCNENDLQNWTCFWCKNTTEKLFQVTSFFEPSTNSFAYTGITSSEIIVSFRGTQIESLENWISNLFGADLVQYKSVRNVFVGKGFLLAYQALRSSMLKEIGEITKSNPSLPVVVVGHSLGAAMAELCAVDLTETLNLTNVHVWNYGDPRVIKTIL